MTAKADVRRAGERAATRLGWLDSRHSFSFGRRYDPANTHHGLLLVNNDDTVKPAGHRHRTRRDSPLGNARRPRRLGLGWQPLGTACNHVNAPSRWSRPRRWSIVVVSRAGPDGLSCHGLEEFLRAIGQSFADHARYANLLLERPVDPRTTQRLRDAVGELTARAAEAGTVAPHVTQADIMSLVRAMRGLVHDAGEVQSWPRFLDIHLAGLRAATSLP